MKEINVAYQTKKVKIFFFENLFDEYKFEEKTKYFILTDTNVGALYLPKLRQLIPEANYLIVPAGEASKNSDTAFQVINNLPRRLSSFSWRGDDYRFGGFLRLDL